MPRKYTSLADQVWRPIEKNSFGCWLREGHVDETGYPRLRLPGRARMDAHRLAYILTYGPIPEGLNVLHLCSAFYPPGDLTNRRCVNPAHLKLGTLAENNHQAAQEGRSARGDRSPSRLHPDHRPRGEQQSQAKLTAAIVREVRWRVAQGELIVPLAKEYGVSAAAIRHVIDGTRWKHVA